MSAAPTVADKAFIQCLAEALLVEAEKLGVIVEIVRVPQQPPAMGNHAAEIRMWDRKARGNG